MACIKKSEGQDKNHCGANHNNASTDAKGNELLIQNYEHISHFLPVSKFQMKLGPRCSMSLLLAKHHIIFSSIKSSLRYKCCFCHLPHQVGLVRSQFAARLLNPLLNWALSFPPLRTPATSTLWNHNGSAHPLFPYPSTSSWAATWPRMLETKCSSPSDITFSPRTASNGAHLCCQGDSESTFMIVLSSTESIYQNISPWSKKDPQVPL